MGDIPEPEGSIHGETAILVAIARLDGKMTGALGAVEGLRSVDSDHEARMRKLEEKRYITPGQLWAGLLGLAGVVGAGAALFSVMH